LTVKTLTEPDFIKHLELAIQFGNPFLFENVDEELDPLLDPVLEKSVVKEGNGLVLKLGKRVLLLSKAILCCVGGIVHVCTVYLYLFLSSWVIVININCILIVAGLTTYSFFNSFILLLFNFDLIFLLIVNVSTMLNFPSTSYVAYLSLLQVIRR
jgi:hypothetical protein